MTPPWCGCASSCGTRLRRLRTPFRKALIHTAPDVGAGPGEPLDDVSKRRLYAHYSLPYDDGVPD